VLKIFLKNAYLFIPKTPFTYQQRNGHIYIVESISKTTVDSESGHVILGVQIKLHVTVECVACRDSKF